MPGTVRKTAAGWVADVSVNGVRKTGLCKTKTEAQARKRELLDQLLQRNATSVHTPQAAAGFTIKEARALSLKVRWANTTDSRTPAINSRHAVEYFGPAFLLKDIDSLLIDGWQQSMTKAGLRPSTINKKISTLRSMFADAELRRLVSSIPKFPRALRERNGKDRVISDQERDAMCAYFIQRGEPAAADVLVFLLETAARWSEAERLQAEDVDLVRRRVSFHRTKNNWNRTTPLTMRAVKALEPHVGQRGRVFGYNYKQYEWLFRQATEAIGKADDAALTIHTTRHTAASKLASQGIPLQQIMAFGGWTSLSSVQRYLHLSTDALSVCVAALEA